MIAQKKAPSCRRWIGIPTMLALIALTACDFDVTNPGPVADDFLDNPAAFGSIVRGVSRQMNNAMNWMGIDVAIRTRELHATQANDFIGVHIEAHLGQTNVNRSTEWNAAQQARWLGEDAVRRLQGLMEPAQYREHPEAANANLWAGYATRLMGEYFCSAVFDGGPEEPVEAFHQRAEELFTEAYEIATAAGRSDLATAALGGRASVRLHLQDWSGAAQDASAVPTDFKFQLPFFGDGDWRYYNALHWYINGNEPWRGLTVWNTYYEDYYAETGDPRVPWADQQELGSGSIEPWGPVPWYTNEKYQSRDDDIDLTSGEEMRLIEAEVLLRENDVVGAMELINGLRERAGVEPWPEPGDIEEAWSLLKRERGIELWLEARRLGDLRRWDDTNTPGALTPHELGLTRDGPDLTNRALCLPIPTSERETNPNIPLS